MATISITRKIQFNKNETKKIAEAYKKSNKVIVKSNPQKIDKTTFLNRLSNKLA